MPRLALCASLISLFGAFAVPVYSAEPASPTADAINLLASWAATLDAATIAEQAEHHHT